MLCMLDYLCVSVCMRERESVCVCACNCCGDCVCVIVCVQMRLCVYTRARVCVFELSDVRNSPETSAFVDRRVCVCECERKERECVHCVCRPSQNQITSETCFSPSISSCSFSLPLSFSWSALDHTRRSDHCVSLIWRRYKLLQNEP